MRPKIETTDGKTIVCLGDNNCVKWAKGKEKQALSILNAGCREAEEILRQLGYDTKSIAELTSDVCGSDCPSINTMFCKNPSFSKALKPQPGLDTNHPPEGNPVKVGGEVPAPWAVSDDTPSMGAKARRRRELTGEVCSRSQMRGNGACKDSEFTEYVRTWRPTYIPFSTYATMPDKAKQLIRELVSRGYVKEQTCCIQYNDKCECVKTDHGFFITARAIDYDKCIKWSRNECVMTVRQALYEMLKYV